VWGWLKEIKKLCGLSVLCGKKSEIIAVASINKSNYDSCRDRLEHWNAGRKGL
jgi:hypothetical protein